MVVNQFRSKQKETGAIYKDIRKKRKCESGRSPTMTKLGENSTKNIRSMGSNNKTRVYYADTVNVFDKSSKKSITAKIKTVTENPANAHFVRRNIITKGTIVDTDKGKVRITSRPGQSGTINGVLV